MFAIVEIYGKQYKVAKGDRVLVNSKIDVAEGKTIKFENVKAVSDKDKNIFGAKDLAKYNVSAKVLEHSRDSKVTISLGLIFFSINCMTALPLSIP